MKGGEIDALVIMNLNYELNDDAPDNIYTFEPKLRDAIVRELLRLSDKGIFGDDLTTPQSYELLRSTLLEAGQKVVSEGIRDVLILDIARQDSTVNRRSSLDAVPVLGLRSPCLHIYIYTK